MPTTPRPLPKDISPKDQGRFWSFVDKTGDCHIWTGYVGGRYGRFAMLGRQWPAHRVAYHLEHGLIPDGYHVLHHCDNNVCVRADHLFVGTHADNMGDMKRKRRYPVGEGHKRSKLTTHDVLEIRRLGAKGAPRWALAACFQTTYGTIMNILMRKSWKHLPEQDPPKRPKMHAPGKPEPVQNTDS